jgi:SAM-dependent methyltransferase
MTTARPPAQAEQPWQLRLFGMTLKKKQKMDLLLRLLGKPAPAERLLLLTNGDNNGAMNYVFRQQGGRWTWGEFEEAPIAEMAAFLGEPVVRASVERLPFDAGAFDTVVVIDVHEHLADPSDLNRELWRIIRPGGRIIVTTPNGDASKPAVRIKNLLGMTKETYGHVRDGYTIPELRAMMSAVGFQPYADGHYANFFTEMVELGINLAYVKVLNRKKPASAADRGHAAIAPSSSDQVRKVEKTLKLYRVIYPFTRAAASFDVLLNPFRVGYAVAVAFRKPA